MNKYIVKNCPACLRMSKLCDDFMINEQAIKCSGRTDCLIKQVIEKCKEAERKCEQLTPAEFKQWFEEDLLLNFFNELFDIEEVE